MTKSTATRNNASPKTGSATEQLPNPIAVSGLQAESAQGSMGRDERIRLAAYALAERRDFAPGSEVDDWLDAEQQIDGETHAQPRAGSEE